MESHILNSYHQARYRSVGHKVDRRRRGGHYERVKYQCWGSEWSQGQTVNMTRSQDNSSDEEENIEVQELAYDDCPENQVLESDIIEEQVLVEGDDYDVIQVYAVDPNLDLEASSDEEHEDYSINNNNKEIIEGYLIDNKTDEIDGLNFNLDTPVVSNVDEYFIKEDKDILAVKDEPVVNDVDEYFIKEKPKLSNINDYLHNAKPITDLNGDNVKSVVNESQQTEEQNTEQNIVNNTEVPINESDLDILPNIEELKRFLLGDMPYSNLKNLQRSCSLPQSPMHNICLDIDDAKTCLSFEDLNLDLSDLAFENEKNKLGDSSKIDGSPRTLTEEDVNSFLITKEEHKVPKISDDLSHQDMEIEHPVATTIKPIVSPKIEPKKSRIKPLTPVKSTVLNFCIEKKATVKKENGDAKDPEDFVDVESCNDTIIPVLEANNLNSLLEQFEATEKLNTESKRIIKIEEQKGKSLTNGMRLQDAGVQLNKTKMRHILMPSTVNASVRRSPSPVHSDHDYCSSKKRYSLPNIKSGQSLLKPEVLSSNNRILSSRHRSCKNKKIVYALSSDDEGDKNKIKKPSVDDSDVKFKKCSVKQTVKIISQPTRKKLSPVHCAEFKDKSNNSVIVKNACKASDTPCSQNSNGSIKLTIKNKSEVILNCDVKDSQKTKPIEMCKPSVSEVEIKVKEENSINSKNIKIIKELDSNKKTISIVDNYNSVGKGDSSPKANHFYTALFNNKDDVLIPQALQPKSEKRSFEEEISVTTSNLVKNDLEKPQKKKKLNLQEYKMRKCVSSNNSSAAVSPEAIFPDLPNPVSVENTPKSTSNETPPNSVKNTYNCPNNEAPKKIFDPIREASRKILMNTKKQKAEAMRKRDEDFVMSKIPKVDNLQLQPLISDAEMMKIVASTNISEVIPIPIAEKPDVKPVPIVEKPLVRPDYEEIVMVSVGTNTEADVFKTLDKATNKHKSRPPDPKSNVNFRINSNRVLQLNLKTLDKSKDKKSSVIDIKPDIKIDIERFKDITATLKSVKKDIDLKISSNSLFASIQDVVMKKAPDEVPQKNKERSKSISPKRLTPFIRPTIVRDYDNTVEHGEDKVILHLGKNRTKPKSSSITVQTDCDSLFPEFDVFDIEAKKKTPSRKRNDSDMSMSSDNSPTRRESPKEIAKKERQRSQSSEKRRSKERYDKFRRSRSISKSKRRRRSISRSRSRSRGRFRRYRRSDSPYRRKRRSRSPYRWPSITRTGRRDYKNRSPSRTRAKSPKKRSPLRSEDRKIAKSHTPSPRKTTVSESSESSSSSSASSVSSDDSGRTRSPPSTPQRPERKKGYRSYSSEDRESNTPVEERRIVFVGKLEKDITKASLRSQFTKFGTVMEVRLHSKEDGSRYGFVTFARAGDAWAAVGAASHFPTYDVGFGGRRAFCRHSYADLDGLEAKYTESAFHGLPVLPPRRSDDIPFEQMLMEMKNKLNQRKGDKDKKDERP